jgi:hypothetical protein
VIFADAVCSARRSVKFLNPVANQLYAAVNPTNAALSNICAGNKDANGKSGDNTQGCIAIFTVTSGTDDPPK